MGLAWGLAYQRAMSRGLFWGIFLSSWAGAKVFYLLFSLHPQAQASALSSSFWLGGGFVFYGGLLGAGAFVLIFSVVLKKFPPERLHLLVPTLAWGHALGRMGCFLAGCCYGSPTDVPWGVLMHQASRHPVQLYEAFGLAIIGGLASHMIRRTAPGSCVIGLYLLSYPILRFVDESFRGDWARGFIGPLSTSQVISVGIFLATILLGGVLRYRART